MLSIDNDPKLLCFFGVLSGLLIFLIGMKTISNTFENIISVKAKLTLHKLTSKKSVGLLLGLLSTALLQSSSATTLIVVSLVHGNLISLYNAVPIIMGANIGTTITAQIIALNFENITPYILIISIACFIFFKKARNKIILNSFLGLILILLGIEVIATSISLLKTINFFTILISKLSNQKLLSVLVGLLTTAILQSSSTAIAILQVMIRNNLIPVITAIPIILGQNIGTCTNTLIGSLTTNTVGRQAAIIHFIFNILGVSIFYFFTDKLLYVSLILSPNNPVRQLANAHSIFNILCTLILLPFSSILVKIAKKIVRD